MALLRLHVQKSLERAVSTGRVLDLRTGDPKLDDPSHIGLWPSGRLIHAEDIASTLTTRGSCQLLIRGAKILGDLSLDGIDGAITLSLQDCYLPDSISIDDARLKRLSLEGSLLEGSLSAKGLQVEAGLKLTRGFKALSWVDLSRATIEGDLTCSGGSFLVPDAQSLLADDVTVTCNVYMNSGFTAEGEVTMLGAQVGGQLVCEEGRFSNREGCAFALDGCNVEDGVFCDNGFEVLGEFRLPGGNIAGDLDLTHSVLRNPGKVALRVDHTEVKGSTLLGGSSIFGRASFVSSRIRGKFNAVGSRISNPGAIAMQASGIRIEDDLIAPDLTAEGAVVLIRSSIGGDVLLRGARLASPERFALAADNAVVKGRVLCIAGFNAEGAVTFRSAELGALNMDGALLDPGGPWALVAVHSLIGTDISLGRGFEAKGGINLSRSRVSGDVTVSEASLLHRDDDALLMEGVAINSLRIIQSSTIRGRVRAFNSTFHGSVILNRCTASAPGDVAVELDGARISGNIVIAQQTKIEGELRFLEADIARQIRCTSCELLNPSGKALAGDGASAKVLLLRDFKSEGAIRFIGTKVARQCIIEGDMAGLSGEGRALQFESSEILGDLRLFPRSPMQGDLSLANTSVGHFRDNAACWASSYDLRSFRYNSLWNPPLPDPNRTSTKQRIRWVEGTKTGYEPQAYDALSAAYANAGLPHRQRHVLIAKNRRRRSRLGMPAKAFSYLDDWLLGFGYRPWRVLVPFGVLVLLGFLFFQAHQAEMIKLDPKLKEVTFDPLGYTLDLLVPVVDLGQRRYFAPDASFAFMKTALVIAGWVLSAAILAALTSFLRRTD